MQRTIIAVGLLSIFESYIQDQLDCKDGFTEARNILTSLNELELGKRFDQFVAAINVLKHGRGRSYNGLLSQIDELPFLIKNPDESFFLEGDVSEIFTLIEVDSDFVRNCTSLIRQISIAIQKIR